MKLVKVLAIGLMLVAGTSASNAMAQQSEFVAGEHYEVTSVKGSEQPVLEEFFNYACAACYSFESFIGQFKQKNPNIPVKMVPVELNPAWKIYVKAYFIGEKLGVLEQSHPKLFHRLHVEKRILKDDADMKAFFMSFGVSEKAYNDVAKSYWLNTQVRMAKQYAFKHKIMKTPTLLVNQRYKLDTQKLGSLPKVEQAIQELSGAQPAPTSAQ